MRKLAAKHGEAAERLAQQEPRLVEIISGSLCKWARGADRENMTFTRFFAAIMPRSA